MSLDKKEKDKIIKACTGTAGTNIVKAAKYYIKPVNGLDILVCGGCLRVFHLLAELQKHKQRDECSSTDSDPTKFNPTADVWAFMLWKNSPDVKGQKLKFVGDNAAMWKMWLELPNDIRRGWLVAGNLLFDMNLIHKSKEREEKNAPFESFFNEKLGEFQGDEVVETKVEATKSPQKSPKIIKRSSVPSGSPIAKKIKLELPKKVDPDANSKNLVHSILDKKYDSKLKKFIYRVRWESKPNDFYTWETEENLEPWKEMVSKYEIQHTTPARPSRSSKSKALDRVKRWTNGSKFGIITGDDENTPDARSEEDEEEIDLPLSEEDEFMPDDPLGSVGDAQESEDSVYDSDYCNDEIAVISSHGKTKKKPQKQPAKSKTVPQASKKPEEKIFHLSNCQGSIRVNGKSVPKLKSGVHPANANASLTMLSPLLCKKKVTEEQSGLVIITNDPAKNKPGFRKRQGFKLQDDSTSSAGLPAPAMADSGADIEILVEKTKPAAQKLDAIKLLDLKTSKVERTTTMKTIKVPAQVKSPAHKPSIMDILVGNRIVAKPLEKKLEAAPKITQPIIKPSQPTGIQSSPQHVVMPKGVDPGAVEVPAGMQLMVSDTGEYYLLPQQPEGSTVALAQDPESGAVQVVSIPEAVSTPGSLVTGDKAPTTLTTQPDTLLTTGIAEQGSGLMLVMTQSGELVLVSSDQIQNSNAIQLS